MTGAEVDTWLAANTSSAAIARRVIYAVLEGTDLRDRDVQDVALATTEAVANAIEHGTPCGERGVRLRVRVDAERVAVEVSDCGRFPSGPPGNDPDRGRGLPIIGAVCDVVELLPSRGRTTIRFAKRLAPERDLAVA